MSNKYMKNYLWLGIAKHWLWLNKSTHLDDWVMNCDGMLAYASNPKALRSDVSCSVLPNKNLTDPQH